MFSVRMENSEQRSELLGVEGRLWAGTGEVAGGRTSGKMGQGQQWVANSDHILDKVPESSLLLSGHPHTMAISSSTAGQNKSLLQRASGWKGGLMRCV